MSEMQERSEQKPRNFVLLLLTLVLTALCLGQLLGFRSFSASEQTYLPVSIRASSQADYSEDQDHLQIPPIEEGILLLIVQDLKGTGSPWERISTMQVSLSTPVPTMTVNIQVSTTSQVSPTGVTVDSTTPNSTLTAAGTDTTPVYTSTGTVTAIAATQTPFPATSAPPATKKPKPTQRPRPTKKP